MVNRNQAQIGVSAKIQDTVTSRFHRSSGLFFEPGRDHKKFRSTDLYPIEEWLDLDDENLFCDLASMDLQSGLALFQLPEALVDNIRAQMKIDEGATSNEMILLQKGLIDRIKQELDSNLPIHQYQFEDSCALLVSDPTLRIAAGRTTNGLHFDDGGGTSLRVGINIGDVPRFVYFVPEFKHGLMDQIPHYDRNVERLYRAIANIETCVLSVLVQPGEGWTLPTKLFLHDGRRAEPVGLSGVVLLSANMPALLLNESCKPLLS